MLVLSKEIIKNIAEELDGGMACFLHLHTHEIVSYPDELRMGEPDEEDWGEEMRKAEQHPKDYLEFEAMNSRESFRVMEDFIAQIPDNNIRRQFEEIILRRKPFQQFKNLLLDHPGLRQEWFVYKEKRYEEYVMEQIEAFNQNEKFTGKEEND